VQLTIACDRPGPCEVNPGTCADGICTYEVRTRSLLLLRRITCLFMKLKLPADPPLQLHPAYNTL
jgi:hypothetical protein